MTVSEWLLLAAGYLLVAAVCVVGVYVSAFVRAWRLPEEDDDDR